MGFSDYQFSDRATREALRKQINPVWRGIGCLLILALSVSGYLFAGWFLRANAQNGWIYIPPEVIRPPYISLILPPGLLFQVVVAALFMLLSFGLLSFFYALFFPKQPGEKDVPTPRRRRRSGQPWSSRGR